MPRRYLHCTLDTYRPDETYKEQVWALGAARAFVLTFPAGQGGLLFTGPCGTGKTHLAVAILRQLVLEQGAQCVFADYQELLSRIQATFSRASDGESEERVLAPILEAELLVLDDLGARRSTAWAEDTIGHVLNVRYNEERVTIITTNLPDAAPERPADEGREPLRWKNVVLSDRVPERVVSRIHEMCRTVPLAGKDHRRDHPSGGSSPEASAIAARLRSR